MISYGIYRCFFSPFWWWRGWRWTEVLRLLVPFPEFNISTKQAELAQLKLIAQVKYTLRFQFGGMWLAPVPSPSIKLAPWESLRV